MPRNPLAHRAAPPLAHRATPSLAHRAAPPLACLAALGIAAAVAAAESPEAPQQPRVVMLIKSLSEKGSDPLEASRFNGVFGLAGEGQTPFRTGSNADPDNYEAHRTMPLHGEVNGQVEPIAWTRSTGSKGRVFYTSLGHPSDFEQPWFRDFLTAAMRWAME